MKKLILLLASGCAALAGAAPSLASDGHRLFLKTARESADLSTVTLPLYRGWSHNRKVWFVITDASTRDAARTLGVNYAPKLALTANTAAVEQVKLTPRGIDFPATVDFSPNREIESGPYGPNETGLPLGFVRPGAVGEPGYSPLIQLPGGTVLNASHVANSSGRTDKATDVDARGIVGSATFSETAGLYANRTIHYISLDASAAAAAVLENVTWAPALADAPGGNPADENTNPATSSRAGIIAFTNGQTGLGNPNRQGLNSTILDGPLGETNVAGPVPLNIIQSTPNGLEDTLYSPLWDAHLTRWDPSIPLSARTRQTSFEAVQALAAAGRVTNVNGSAWGRSGPVPNCPIISTDRAGEFVIPPPN